jgi:hypothetical protein
LIDETGRWPESVGDSVKEEADLVFALIQSPLPYSPELQMAAEDLLGRRKEALALADEILADNGRLLRTAHPGRQALTDMSWALAVQDGLQVSRGDTSGQSLAKAVQITRLLYRESSYLHEQTDALALDGHVGSRLRWMLSSHILDTEALQRILDGQPSFDLVAGGARQTINNAQRAWRSGGVVDLVNGSDPRHDEAALIYNTVKSIVPTPLDRNRTARLMDEMHELAISSVTSPHLKHQSIRKIAEDAELQFSDEVWSKILDQVPVSEWPPAHLEELLSIENPVGRHAAAVEALYLAQLVENVHRRTAAHRAHEILLASLIFEQEQGVLPEDLPALVKAGYLDEVPIDPFTAEPMKFDPERAAAWSTGPDRSDNGAPFKDGQSACYSPDFGWRLLTS